MKIDDSQSVISRTALVIDSSKSGVLRRTGGATVDNVFLVSSGNGYLKIAATDGSYIKLS